MTTTAKRMEEIIGSLPTRPGVYIMKDVRGKPIYVGKAKYIRSRVRSYFRPAGDPRVQVKFLMKRVEAIEAIVTGTEKEALILENNLIKMHHPRYNIRLRDEKTYIGLRIDLRRRFPVIETTRRIQKDGCLYFGPYTSSASMWETLNAIQRIFPLRTCTDVGFDSARRMGRPCLEYEMKRCRGPCCDLVGEAQYREIVQNAVLFLRGQSRKLIEHLTERMSAAATEEAFEEAAEIRDRIDAIERTVERQKIVSDRLVDRDVIAAAGGEGQLAIQILFVRQGKLLGGDVHHFREMQAPLPELLGSFLNQYYSGERFIPPEIVLDCEPEGAAALAAVLSERAGGKVRLHTAKRGERMGLLEMARENARLAFEQKAASKESIERALEDLRARLRLATVPRRIEGFDISNIQGRFAVGSSVAFVGGMPERKRYRRYRVKTVSAPDDYAMLREVLTRRLRRGVEEDDLPDLLLIDGGKGHLQVGLSVLADLGIGTVAAAAIAKERSETRGGARRVDRSARSRDRIFVANVRDALRMPPSSQGLFLLQRVRDEAHRFAIDYHRLVRRRGSLDSALLEVPGIGPAKTRTLLRNFGSLKRLRGATLDAIEQVRGISHRDAEALYRALHRPDHRGENSGGT